MCQKSHSFKTFLSSRAAFNSVDNSLYRHNTEHWETLQGETRYNVVKISKKVCYIMLSLVIIDTIDIRYCALSVVVISLYKIIRRNDTLLLKGYF